MENNLDEHFEALGLRLQRSPEEPIHSRALQYGFLYGPKNNELYKLGFGLVLPSSSSSTTTTTSSSSSSTVTDLTVTSTVTHQVHNDRNTGSTALPIPTVPLPTPSPLMLEAQQLSSQTVLSLPPLPRSSPLPYLFPSSANTSSTTTSSSSKHNSSSFASPIPYTPRRKPNNYLSPLSHERIRRNSYPSYGYTNNDTILFSNSSTNTVPPTSSSFLLSPLATIQAANQLVSNSTHPNTVPKLAYAEAYNKVNTLTVPLSTKTGNTDIPALRQATSTTTPGANPTAKDSPPARTKTVSSPSTPERCTTKSMASSYRRKGIYGTLPTEFASPRYMHEIYGEEKSRTIIENEEKYRLRTLITTIVTSKENDKGEDTTKSTEISSPMLPLHHLEKNYAEKDTMKESFTITAGTTNVTGNQENRILGTNKVPTNVHPNTEITNVFNTPMDDITNKLRVSVI